MKTCSRCLEVKSEDQFVKSRCKSDGIGAHCKVCDARRTAERWLDPKVRDQIREYTTRYRADNLKILQQQDLQRYRQRYTWISSLKSTPCMDCQNTFQVCCMDFDHVRGVKAKGLGKLVTHSRDRILGEVAKCDVVCACCHRIRTQKQRSTTQNPQRQAFHAKVTSLKEGNPCKDCGVTFPPVAMDFDHVSGDKMLNVSSMRHLAWGAVLAEIAKCELVCANCHRVRTWQQKNQKVASHG